MEGILEMGMTKNIIEQIEASFKQIEKIKNNYSFVKVPRFKIDEMNQAEFLDFLIIASFHAGVKWEKERTKDDDETI